MYSRPDIIYPHQFPKLWVLPLILQSRQFHTKIKTSQRIGPHNLDVISVLVGCLINPNLRGTKKVKGTNFRFRQSVRHKDYLFFLYRFFFERGYCTASGPREYRTTLINASKVSKTYYGYEFDIFTFSSLNWLYELFYVNGIKVIKPELINYFTPISLAFLIMDDGGSKSVRISTNNFTLQEVEFLVQMFNTKFGLDCTVQKLSKGKGNTPKDKYSIYIKVASLPRLRELIVPYMHPSMLYKLGL
ncbi:laglidadg DNA endonuclease [Tuber indicum]|nr:laglidadg DNA endonuclease [Tuber indicum]